MIPIQIFRIIFTGIIRQNSKRFASSFKHSSSVPNSEIISSQFLSHFRPIPRPYQAVNRTSLFTLSPFNSKEYFDINGGGQMEILNLDFRSNGEYGIENKVIDITNPVVNAVVNDQNQGTININNLHVLNGIV